MSETGNRSTYKLEIGPGENPVGSKDQGWTHASFEVQWGFEQLPFNDNLFKEVYASHVLEHIPWYHTLDALKDAYRVLEPGGELEIWVPDFKYIIDCYLRGSCGDKWRRFNGEGDYMKWVNGRIFTYGPDANNWHHACFDSSYLQRLFREAGFKQVRRIVERTRGTSHGPIDLGVKGLKA